jgi:PAP2 superfamily
LYLCGYFGNHLFISNSMNISFKKWGISLLACWLCLAACQKGEKYNQQAANSPALLQQVEKHVTEVIVHDIFSPVVASRIYAYSSLAAYEALAPSDSTYRSMAGQLRGFSESPRPEDGKEYNFTVAATYAFLKVGKALTFSADLYPPFEEKLKKNIEDTGLPSEVMERSVKFGESIAEHILDYAKKDNYKQTRGFRHTVTNDEGTWVPTPPAYMDAVEPYWYKIRPFVLDTCTQFPVAKPHAYNMTDKKGPYYQQVVEVYEKVKNLSQEERGIANFWDCNPFKMNVTGHAMFATKKISPGGHWIAIVGQLSRQQKMTSMQTAEVYLMTSLAIFDSFISCWTNKYTTNKVRPETVINAQLDKDWLPTLQTPPFPEYTSGHSSISGASAAVLNQLVGKNIAFVDSTETPFGLPVVKFESFDQAASQASISRLYGGIHFRQALDEGLKNGYSVGTWVLGKVKTRK